MKKTILLIHDDAQTLNDLASELSDLTQMISVRATDGVQACQKARNQKFDIIITKWIMPKVFGAELINTLKLDNTNEETPILIIGDMSEEEEKEFQQKCSDVKSVEIIKGDFSAKVLSEKVKSFIKKASNKKQFKLDVNFINPFIDASINTLTGMCNVEDISSMRPYLMSKHEQINVDISGTLAISSPHFKGSIAVSFADEVYKQVISKMMDEEIEEVNEDNQDGAAEIINIIFGETKTVLSEKGLNMEKAIPDVVRGPKHQIYPDSKVPVLLIPFNSNVGKFYIQICVKAI